MEQFASWAEDMYEFESNDLVWLKYRKTGKLLPKSTGPHCFVEYYTGLKKSAWIEMSNGKKFLVSATDLYPAS